MNIRKKIEKLGRKGNKGTVWYLSDVVVAITSLLSVLFMIFIAALVIFVMSVQLDVNAIGLLMYGEPLGDSTMLAFLDSTSGGHSMKELLSYTVYAGGTNITVDGEEFDMKSESKETMEHVTRKAYRLSLELEGETVELASRGEPELVPHAEVKTVLYSWNTESELKLVMAK